MTENNEGGMLFLDAPVDRVDFLFSLFLQRYDQKVQLHWPLHLAE